jgi:hypothetical protein
MLPKQKSPKKRYTEQTAHGASSKFGQLIGEAFADVVLNYIHSYLREQHPDYILLEPEAGKRLLRLEMFGGTSRQLDNVIALKDSREPIALLESKWLKDARHHNDKGAWILQLKEVSKKYPTVRGAAAILAGYWTEGVGIMFKSEAGVQMVQVATDEEVYETLQEPLNRILSQQGLPAFDFDARIIRESLPRAWDLANCLMDLEESGELKAIAAQWLAFVREQDSDGNQLLGSDLIRIALSKLLEPLPQNPAINRIEVALHIDTGNTIYCEFHDIEEAFAFLQMYHQNPKAILDKIKPRKTPPKE